MKTYAVTITERGQITLPAEIRRQLGVKPGDQVQFEVEGNNVRVVPMEFTIETAFASVTPIHRPEDFEAMIRDAKDEHAARLMEQMRLP